MKFVYFFLSSWLIEIHTCPYAQNLDTFLLENHTENSCCINIIKLDALLSTRIWLKMLIYEFDVPQARRKLLRTQNLKSNRTRSISEFYCAIWESVSNLIKHNL